VLESVARAGALEAACRAEDADVDLGGECSGSGSGVECTGSVVVGGGGTEPQPLSRRRWRIVRCVLAGGVLVCRGLEGGALEVPCRAGDAAADVGGECSGSGVAKGGKRETCKQCGGHGEVIAGGGQRVELFDLSGLLEPDLAPGQRQSGGGEGALQP
jgi:hypothetical protein